MASIHFYKYFLEKNGQPTNYDMLPIIDHIWNLNPRQKYLNMNRRWYSMSAHLTTDSLSNDYNDKSLRFFWIDKSINHDLYTGTFASSSRRPLSEILGEGEKLFIPASCLLISSIHLLAIFQPQGSPSSTDIANYLMKYVLTEFGNNKFNLELIPLTNNTTFNDLNPNYKIKNAYMTIDPERFSVLGSHKDNVESNKFENVLNNLWGFVNHFDPHSRFSIDIFKSRQEKSIKFPLVEFLINSVFNSKITGLIKAGVLVKGPKDLKYNKVEIDKNSRVLIPFKLTEKSPGKEEVFENMAHMYESGKFPNTGMSVQELKSLNTLLPSEIHFKKIPE